ncbi:MAG: nucleotidyltransferase domain-containing protein [Bacteroidota bacterium]
MRQKAGGVRQEAASELNHCVLSLNRLNLPAAWRSGLEGFCTALQQRIQPECVILVGSAAAGTYYAGSDLDVLVIASALPVEFLARLAVLAELRPPGLPLETVGYTPDEFRRMLREGHVTALEAYDKGLPLLGEAWFRQEREAFLALRARGLRREKGAWVLPPGV